MSFLPQRKKSSEEIAKLRETFGIPASPNPSNKPAAPNNPPAAPVPAADLHRDATPAAPAPAPAEVPPPADADPRPARTFRKSEPAIARTAGPVSHGRAALPVRRHSQQELDACRRHEITTLQPPPANPKLTPAHPLVLVVGYLAALAGALPLVWPLTWTTLPITVPATCVACALLVALYVFRRKPLSSHHAGFIAVICLFVSVFGALHYFPHLAHAT